MRRDFLPAVLKGVDEALAAGFMPLKFNAVVLRGINDDELCDLVSFAPERKSQMRFIEFMPIGAARKDVRNQTVTMREMLEQLKDCFDSVTEENSGAGLGVPPERGARRIRHFVERTFLRLRIRCRNVRGATTARRADRVPRCMSGWRKGFGESAGKSSPAIKNLRAFRFGIGLIQSKQCYLKIEKTFQNWFDVF